MYACLCACSCSAFDAYLKNCVLVCLFEYRCKSGFGPVERRYAVKINNKHKHAPGRLSFTLHSLPPKQRLFVSNVFGIRQTVFLCRAVGCILSVYFICQTMVTLYQLMHSIFSVINHIQFLLIFMLDHRFFLLITSKHLKPSFERYDFMIVWLCRWYH